VPTGAGGVTDILARLVGKSISEQLGQPVIIDIAPAPAAPSERGRVGASGSPTATPC